MAKRGFASKDEAEEAIRMLGRYATRMVPYHYRDPVTGVRKWFIREAPRPREGKRAKSQG